MKSIKEKSVEFAKENINSLGFISQEHVDGYIAGANYVLEEIEEFQKLFSACMNARAYGYLKSVIKQLKK